MKKLELTDDERRERVRLQVAEAKKRYNASEKGKASQRSYYLKNKDRLRSQTKAWSDQNKDAVKAWHQEFYQKNKEAYRIRAKNWRDKNPKAAKAMYQRNVVKNAEQKNAYRNRPEIIGRKKQYDLAYYEENKARIIKRTSANTSRRIKQIPWVKISSVCRARIRAAMKGNPQKGERSIELIGCSWLFLKKYIESKFLPGMSWSNYSVHGWHIDHIIPCASFDLTKKEERLKCFHYTNLQPLWAKDNIIKKDKIMPIAV